MKPTQKVFSLLLLILVLLTSWACAEEAKNSPELQLNPADLSIMVGDKATLTPSLTNGEMPDKPKLAWTTSDKSVVTVAKGKVKGVAAGTATVTCELMMEDGGILSASCVITVRVGVKSVKPMGKTLTLMVGASTEVNVVIKPDNATNPSLQWSSDTPAVASVTEDGTITAHAPGRCNVTCKTMDGTEKSAIISVFVPTLRIEIVDDCVISKDGLRINAYYYGSNASDITVKASGNVATVTHAFKTITKTPEADGAVPFTIIVSPNKAGKLSVAVTDPNSKESSQKFTLTVEHSAVYDTTSYPKINYKDAYRYPDQYKGNPVSFSGKVLQVMDDNDTVVLRVTSKGRWDNVVYVIHSKSDSYINILEDDSVTIYGTLRGNYSYESIWGQTITIPCVDAEKIMIK